MSEMFQYQEIFKTINVPKPERRLALRAKNLLDSANGLNEPDPMTYAHLSRVVTNREAGQAFWDYEDDEAATYDRLAITLMHHGVTIALEHRRFDRNNEAIRQSLLMGSGIAKVYTSDLLRSGSINNGDSSEIAVQQFKDQFFATAASLGLYHQIERRAKVQLQLIQNESSEASFASAA